MYIENNIIKKQFSIWLLIMFFLIAFMIVVGGLTRLTDSGLSITKWELFSGILPPFTKEQWIFYFQEYQKIPEFKIQNYTMDIKEFKILPHRFLGRLIIYFLLNIFFNMLSRIYWMVYGIKRPN